MRSDLVAMDVERERLKRLLEKAQREGEVLKRQIDEQEDLAPEESPSTDDVVMSSLVHLVDDGTDVAEKAPSYAELMESAGVVTPSVARSLDTFSETSDDKEDDGAPANAAAKITIEAIRSQARAYATEQKPRDRLDHLLSQVKVTPPRKETTTSNPSAALAAKSLLASMRAEAEAYAEQKAKEREAVVV